MASLHNCPTRENADPALCGVQRLGMGPAAWIKLPATLFTLRDEPLMYPACMADKPDGRKCQKKMQENGDGSWGCPSCGAQGQPMWRYLLNMSIQDHTGQLMNVSAFGESGEPVMDGMTATEAQAVCFVLKAIVPTLILRRWFCWSVCIWVART